MLNKRLAMIFLILFTAAAAVSAQGTSFVYQGKLSDTGTPQTGLFDFTFKLCSDSACTSQIGSTLTADDVTVTNGVFKTSLDFGSTPFSGDTGHYLEIAVRTGASTGAYTTLTPRQALTSMPYAIQSLNAAQLGGVAANQYVTTTNGGTNFIQNIASPLIQPSSQFHISGSGIADGALSAGTQYNLGVNRILGSAGTSTLFVGVGAGTANTGNYNSFLGSSAGSANTSGFANTFAGAFAGTSNTNGAGNSFFGRSAGVFSNGGNNSFFGLGAGDSNTSGSGNTFVGGITGDTNTTGTENVLVGSGADVGANNLTNATAIGAHSQVTQNYSLILGGINGINGASADTNVGIGTTAPSERLHVVGNGLFTGNLTVNGTFSSNILSNPGNSNLFAGVNAGISNTTGSGNVFLGPNAGFANTTGTSNSFMGFSAGTNNQGGGSNTFVGSVAGVLNTAGADNSLFGNQAGANNTLGNGNAFFGKGAGSTNSIGTNNTVIGTFADVTANNLTNATAVGYAAQVSQSNSLVLGGVGVNVGIGTTAPSQKFHVVGNSLFAGDLTVSGTFSSNILSNPGTANLFGGINAGVANTTGSGNVILGYNAGTANTSGTSNSFVGVSAGTSNQGGNANTFVGNVAGSANSSGADNSFVGAGSGSSNGLGSSNAFFGRSAGSTNSTGSNNTLIGAFADVTANNLTNATAVGYAAQVSQSNSLVLGGLGGGAVNVGIGTATPSERLNVVGNGLFTGTLAVNTLGAAGATTLCRNAANQIATCSSSLRYKTNVGAFGNGIDLIRRLRPITFDWKDGGMHDLGLGAEDVAKIEPLLVTYNAKGQVEGVKYDRVGVVLVNAVNEQQTQIDMQQKQLEEQRKLIANQQAEIEALKALVCSQNAEAAICKKTE